MNGRLLILGRGWCDIQVQSWFCLHGSFYTTFLLTLLRENTVTLFLALNPRIVGYCHAWVDGDIQMGSSVHIRLGDWNKMLPLDSSCLLTWLPQKTPTPTPTPKCKPPYSPKKTQHQSGFSGFQGAVLAAKSHPGCFWLSSAEPRSHLQWILWGWFSTPNNFAVYFSFDCNFILRLLMHEKMYCQIRSFDSLSWHFCLEEADLGIRLHLL